MKSALQACVIIFFIIIIMVVIAVYNHVSKRITDEEMLYSKSSDFCLFLIQQKLPASYQTQEVNVTYEKGSDNELQEKIPKNNYNLFKLDYEQGKLSLFNFVTLIKFSVKNSFGVKSENIALCEFDVIHKKNYGFYLPHLEAITIGYERFVGADLLLLFPKSINPVELNQFSFWEKLNYLIHKNNISIINK